MNLPCLRVRDDFGSIDFQHQNMTVHQHTKTMLINNRIVEYNCPILLHKTEKWIYMHLNSEEVVAVPGKYYSYVNEFFEKLEIGCVKVPEKEVQLCAAAHPYS